MTEKIATQLERIFEMLAGVESRIQNLEAHRIGRKKTGETRPVIVRFLRFPERELVFPRVRELADDIDIKVYADFPREISERRKKQWPRLKKAREEGKTAFFSKPEPDKLFIDGRFHVKGEERSLILRLLRRFRKRDAVVHQLLRTRKSLN
ncbi:unnamed protein product [Porites lobata]|uniref:Uncharacterized protein n=1 Tax=Porites lobata TaxID=104759 RepID=A0ABN8QIS7_9CNID|nr:unnamed protein product [Porites lobata]